MGKRQPSTPRLPRGKAEELLIKSEASKRASVEPFPGPLADAFCEDSIVVGGTHVRKVVASDFKVLKQLDSPIVKQLLELQKSPGLQEEIAYSDEEEWEMVWQFTHDPKAVREALSRGRAEFRKMCAEQVGDHLPTEVCRLIIGAVMMQLARNISTAVKYSAEMEKNGAGSFFRELQPEQKTGSVGS